MAACGGSDEGWVSNGTSGDFLGERGKEDADQQQHHPLSERELQVMKDEEIALRLYHELNDEKKIQVARRKSRKTVVNESCDEDHEMSETSGGGCRGGQGQEDDGQQHHPLSERELQEKKDEELAQRLHRELNEKENEVARRKSRKTVVDEFCDVDLEQRYRQRPQRSSKKEAGFFNERELFKKQLAFPPAGAALTDKKQLALPSAGAELYSAASPHLEVRTSVRPDIPSGERLPRFQDYPSQEELDAVFAARAADAIEVYHEKGAVPVPVDIRDVTRRTFARFSILGPGTRAVYDQLVRHEEDYDVFELIEKRPKDPLYKHAKKYGEQFGRDVQNALHGEIHRDIEMREMRDPTDAVVRHQFVEGGKVYGIYAKTSIPAFTPLGQYTGHVLIDEQRDPRGKSQEDDEGARKQGLRSRKEQEGGSSHRRPSTSDVAPHSSVQSKKATSSHRGESGGSSSRGPHSAPASAGNESDTESDSDDDDDDYGEYSLNLPENPKHPDHRRIYVNSKDHANEMSYINDSRGSGLNSSVEYVGILCNGMPTVVIVTTRDVKAGEQIYVEYGDASYWNPQMKKEREKAARVQAMLQGTTIKTKKEQGNDSDEELIVWTEPVNHQQWQPKSAQKESQVIDGGDLAEEERLLSQSVEGLELQSIDDAKREDVESHVRWVRKNASAIQEKGYRPSEKVMGLIAEAEEWAKGGGKDAEKQRKGIKSIIQAAKLLAHECITGLLDQAYKTWEEYADEMTQVARARDEIMVPGSVVWEKQATRLDEFVLGWTKEKLDDLEERGVIDTHERDLADLNTAHINFLDPSLEANKGRYVKVADQHIKFLCVLEEEARFEVNRIKKTIENLREKANAYIKVPNALERSTSGSNNPLPCKKRKRKHQFY